jgi:glutamate/tyrosine decarboxylase-like PLP-dependent enzyme
VIELPSTAHGQLAPEALEGELARGGGSPTVVLLLAGDLTMGAYDSFETLIPIARRHGAWVHVDGAYGLWAAASPRYRHLLRGVEGADSWATDGHKWLNVPYDCGYAFVADPATHRAAMSHREPYLQQHHEARDQMDWNPEWSRRARGFATYAALRQLGRKGVAELVEQCCEHARSLVLGIGRLAGAQVVWEPTINQGLVRFLDANAGACEPDHDRRTDEVIARVLAGGEAYFGGTTWHGRRAMRVSVCNWRTSAKDVERAVEAVRRALADGS